MVVPMSQNDFYDFRSVRGCLIRRKETDEREKVSFSKAAVLEVTEPLKTKVKKTHGALQSFQTLNHAPRRGRRPSLQNAIIRRKYDGPVPVTPAKKKDLLDLLPLIPPVHHHFFESLVVSTPEANSRNTSGKKAGRGKRRARSTATHEEMSDEDGDEDAEEDYLSETHE